MFFWKSGGIGYKSVYFKGYKLLYLVTRILVKCNQTVKSAEKSLQDFPSPILP